MPEPKDHTVSAKRMCQWIEDPKVEIWFGDECRIEADPRQRGRWIEPGSKPMIPCSGAHVRCSIIGVLRPADGALSTLIFNRCNIHVFQVFLDILAIVQPKEGIRQILLLAAPSARETNRRSSQEKVRRYSMAAAPPGRACRRKTRAGYRQDFGSHIWWDYFPGTRDQSLVYRETTPG